MERPIIGVLLNVLDTPSAVYGLVERHYINRAYQRAVELGGGVPVALPLSADEGVLAKAMSICDGLLFTGGVDVDPALYGEEPRRGLGDIMPELDRCWMDIAAYTYAHRIPTLAVCRGMQLLNVAAGGTLWQDIAEAPGVQEHVQTLRRAHPFHSVAVEQDSRLAGLIGTAARVNSMHHQAVRALGRGLRAVASAADGVVEAFESVDGAVLAVQWHPEEMLDSAPEMRELFADLCRRSVENGKGSH